jgi:hypothetical protein
MGKTGITILQRTKAQEPVELKVSPGVYYPMEEVLPWD